MRTSDAQAAVRQTIMRSGSISCDVFGRSRVASLLSSWFDNAGVPAQVIGALYVFEAYHRDLPGFLSERMTRAAAATIDPLPGASKLDDTRPAAAAAQAAH